MNSGPPPVENGPPTIGKSEPVWESTSKTEIALEPMFDMKTKLETWIGGVLLVIIEPLQQLSTTKMRNAIAVALTSFVATIPELFFIRISSRRHRERGRRLGRPICSFSPSYFSL
jgi:hypothetical protein